MIRFVRLGTQIGGLEEDGVETEHFAWFDTSTDMFVRGWDGQTQAFDLGELFEEICRPDSPIRKLRTHDTLLTLIGRDLRQKFWSWLPPFGDDGETLLGLKSKFDD